jgi:hypothetical protein
MPLYLVERHLPGISLRELTALQRAEVRACAVLVARGKAVSYLRGTFAPGESRCLCLFEAPNADAVQEVNDRAQVPYSRIVLVVELLPDQPPDRPP